MPDVLALALKFETFDWTAALTELLVRCIVPMEINMTHKAHIVHHIHGRVRVRIPSKRHDHTFFNDVATRLGQVDEVKSVACTPQTGSVLMHYDGDLTSLLVRLAATGLTDLLELEMGDPPIAPVAEGLVAQVMSIDRQLQVATDGQLDGRTIALVALLIATGVQIFRGNLFGPAVPLLWYAAETVRRLGANRPAEPQRV